MSLYDLGRDDLIYRIQELERNRDLDAAKYATVVEELETERRTANALAEQVETLEAWRDKAESLLTWVGFCGDRAKELSTPQGVAYPIIRDPGDETGAVDRIAGYSMKV